MNVKEIFLTNFNFFRPLRTRSVPEGPGRETMPSYPIPQKGTLYFRGNPIESSGNSQFTNVPSYGVVARYTEEENKKVLETVKLLTKIANGNYDDPDLKIETFSDRVKRNFLNKEPDKRSFRQAVFDSTIECYELLARLHPEEVPCLHAIFLTAGSGGTALTVALCSMFLDAAILGHLNDKNIDYFKELPNQMFGRVLIDGDNNANAALSLFAGKILAYMQKTTPPHLASAIPGFFRQTNPEAITQFSAIHERHCSGMSFAKTIIKQSADAALELSKDLEVTNWHRQYGSNHIAFRGEDFAQETERIINKIFEEATRHFQINE